MAGYRADVFHLFLRKTVALEQGVEGAAEVEGGVGERAVEVE